MSLGQEKQLRNIRLKYEPLIMHLYTSFLPPSPPPPPSPLPLLLKVSLLKDKVKELSLQLERDVPSEMQRVRQLQRKNATVRNGVA